MNATTVIIFANQKGGTGKSSLLILFACYLARLGYKIEVIDADPQKTTSNWYRGYEGGIENLKCTEVEFEDVADEISAIRTEALTDFILLDTAGAHTDQISEKLTLADLAIIPVKASQADTDSSRTTAAYLTAKKIPYCYLLNQVRSNDSDLTPVIVGLSVASNGNIIEKVIGSRKAYERFHGAHTKPWDAPKAPKADILKEVDDAWKALVKKFDFLAKELTNA